MYVIVWEFRAQPGCEAEFANAYAADGRWSKLFARAEGYRGTELLLDASDPYRFVTIDRWTSERAFDAFRTTYAGEYDAVDRECESLTADERLVGRFETP
jgi:heme-degrading monooxygenase HmoA